jgi:hypothetical protein
VVIDFSDLTRLPATVIAKFVELFDAIHYATDDLKIAGAEANLNGDFSLVTEINSTCRKMQVLKIDVKSLLSDFESRPKSRVIVKPTPFNASNRTRKPSSRSACLSAEAKHRLSCSLLSTSQTGIKKPAEAGLG